MPDNFDLGTRVRDKRAMFIFRDWQNSTMEVGWAFVYADFLETGKRNAA